MHKKKLTDIGVQSAGTKRERRKGLLVVVVFVFCILSGSPLLGSDDINPATHTWTTEDFLTNWLYAIDDSGNGYYINTIRGLNAFTSLISTHCRTNAGTNIYHDHFSRDFNSVEKDDVDDYWDWYYGSGNKNVSILTSASNTKNCFAYAMDEWIGSANYNYSCRPGIVAHYANYMFIVDAIARVYGASGWTSETGDRIGYHTGSPNYEMDHVTKVTDVDGSGEPTDLRWKNGYSGVYDYDNMDSTEPWSTPGCYGVDENVGSPPTADGWRDDDYEGSDDTYADVFYAPSPQQQCLITPCEV